MRHAHDVRIAQQRIQHVTTRLEIGHAIDRIEMSSTRYGLMKSLARLFEFSRREAEELSALGRREQHARQKVRMNDSVAIRQQRVKFAVLIACAL